MLLIPINLQLIRINPSGCDPHMAEQNKMLAKINDMMSKFEMMVIMEATDKGIAEEVKRHAQERNRERKELLKKSPFQDESAA